MFTGIIEAIGNVVSVDRYGDGLTVGIKAKNIFQRISVDNSISINGVCLTVVHRTRNTIFMNVVKETLSKTNLGKLKVGSRVNIERSVKLNDRLGGHLVQGHVDCTGNIARIVTLKGSWQFDIKFPPEKRKFIIPVGSVAIDGVSLTVAKIRKNSMTIAIIPYTHKHTLFGIYRRGSTVNIEFDIVGKYVESFLRYGNI